jgi:ribosomal protein S30/predicted house-cleaning noncanonical NTP pyrophosphatase (MazG superfamily)
MEQAAKQKYLEEQRAKLVQEIPEFADAEKAGEVQRKIRDVATEAYGFTEEELASVMDARHVKVLNDARKYRELMASKESATKKVRQSKPRVKAGAKKKVDPNRKSREEARKRLKQTGSLQDAVSLIMDN